MRKRFRGKRHSRGRGKTTVKWSSDHAKEAVPTMRWKAKRRVKHVSRKFEKNYAMCLAQQAMYKIESVFSAYCPTDKCKWSATYIGISPENNKIFKEAYDTQEAAGPYGGGGAWSAIAQQQFFQVYVKKYTGSVTVTNVTNAPLHLTCYEVTPRMNLQLVSLGVLSLLASYSQDGNLPDPTYATAEMPYDDPNFTLFMSKQVCTYWKIGKVKKFKLVAGQEAKFKYELADYKITALLDASLAPQSYYYRPGKCKGLIFKHWGVEAEDSATHLNLVRSECMLRFREFDHAEFSQVKDKRKIIHDILTTVHADSNSTFIDEQQALAKTIAVV